MTTTTPDPADGLPPTAPVADPDDDEVEALIDALIDRFANHYTLHVLSVTDLLTLRNAMRDVARLAERRRERGEVVVDAGDLETAALDAAAIDTVLDGYVFPDSPAWVPAIVADVRGQARALAARLVAALGGVSG